MSDPVSDPVSDPARPAGGTRLCRLDELPDPGARGFVFGHGTKRTELFVIRRGDRVYGYVNACPHQGTPLETFPDRFLTRDGRQILCTTHGARFRLTDGRCVHGPCKGKALTPLSLVVHRGEIVLAGSAGKR